MSGCLNRLRSTFITKLEFYRHPSREIIGVTKAFKNSDCGSIKFFTFQEK